MNAKRKRVRYTGTETANIDYHHGQLASIIGVHHFQAVRANRAQPAGGDAYGWTFNHAPLLTYWRDKYYLQYVSCPVSENVPPSRTLLITSLDGVHWEDAVILFPEYRVPEGIYQGPEALAPDSYAMMHQRMGFFKSSCDKMLALGFYGICPNHNVMPNDGLGIGRVVREIHPDGRLDPIYFIRYNSHAGWNETNTSYPLYTSSPDGGFIQACEELLSDKLETAKWWEEDRSQDGFYKIEGNKALSCYRLADGDTVGLWKWSLTSISPDHGETWLPTEEADSLIMAGSKIWGQQIAEGHYVLIYNPSLDNTHRWPLALSTSEDGLNFDRLMLVSGEVPPRRYAGEHKYYGLNYVTGLTGGAIESPDGAIWISYCVNKEDIWVSRIPIPVTSRTVQWVDEHFHAYSAGNLIANWQIYRTLLSTVTMAAPEEEQQPCMVFLHTDPYDYAKAERCFPKHDKVEITFCCRTDLAHSGRMEIEVLNSKSMLAFRMILYPDGAIMVRHGSGTTRIAEDCARKWTNVEIRIDASRHEVFIRIMPNEEWTALRFVMSIPTVDKILFRTGAARRTPTYDTELSEGDLPEVCAPAEESHFYLKSLSIQPLRL
ncbi:hypothetical protein FHS18_006159 [Paenibacillus phyllosphaerae]|uniref:Six-hairpin glycosidase n=1 Tax=Paenibacillus phyllosphaerae TaxID=274593 RepID=A0A7W5FR70_9BACL|nr:six-hairpin glycosidase [Paenibacillus phyllosphaerae]MBB3114043.1 hypothetical protein [Paenibacillus phyllosphaerae]